MRGLGNLIRLHRWRLDEKRREISDLENLADSFLDQARLLEEELKSEQALAKASPQTSMTYSGFAEAVVDRREKLAESTARVEKQIEQVNDELIVIFQEVKRYEILKRQQDQAARDKWEKSEQAMFDELGLELFRRRDSADLG